MSVVKLMSRIVNPNLHFDESEMASQLHDHTYGITSDPLTQFACVFSALIHDVDHKGVPNTQLAKEDPVLASLYNKKSVAEQKSVDLAWHLLQDEKFSNLQRAIYSNSEELKRFRQLVVNSGALIVFSYRHCLRLRQLESNTSILALLSLSSHGY